MTVGPPASSGTDQRWDVIVAGGGSAGCVLAGRLSEDPKVRVLLIEAGPPDSSRLIRIPKGTVKLMTDPRYAYFYETDWRSEGGKPEVVPRGRGLGGSSSINGVVYNRAQAEDYADWTALGLQGWSWDNMLPCYRGLEDSALPETEWRGRGGVIPLRVATRLPPFAEAVVEAAAALDVPRKDDPNDIRQLGVAPVAENIDGRGERVGAAQAFLPPEARRRPNLRILTDTRVDRVLFEGRRAVGVLCTSGTEQEEHPAGEVVLCLGGLESPRLLQLSGIGPARHLAALGIDVVADSPGVGANCRDHYSYMCQWRLRDHRDCENRAYSGWRLAANVARYFAFRSGPLARSAMQLVLSPEVMPGHTRRADAMALFAPYSFMSLPGKDDEITMEEEPGCTFVCFPLRGTSEGSVTARSADPAEPPLISPNYLATEYDRAVSVNLFRFMRRLVEQPVLEQFVVGEAGEAAEVETDDEILDYLRRTGKSAYHNSGTCKMGVDDDPTAVLDDRLRVRGVSGLRVADLSAAPLQLSANTHAPALAIGWRAADLIREDLSL